MLHHPECATAPIDRCEPVFDDQAQELEVVSSIECYAEGPGGDCDGPTDHGIAFDNVQEGVAVEVWEESSDGGERSQFYRLSVVVVVLGLVRVSKSI